MWYLHPSEAKKVNVAFHQYLINLFHSDGLSHALIQYVWKSLFCILRVAGQNFYQMMYFCSLRLWGEHSGSVVECLTRDRGAVGLSLTGVTALYPWARHINPSLVLVQPRKTHPYRTERLLMGRKESNQTKSWRFSFFEDPFCLSADPDEMPHYHLGLHCLRKYLLRSFWSLKSWYHSHMYDQR